MINSLILSLLLGLSGVDALELGEEKLKEQRWEEAIMFFKQAVLSDFGPPTKASAYWNMYIAYAQLNKDDDAAESIFMFKETVDDYLEYLKSLGPKAVGHPGVAWMATTGMKDKMIYSRAILDIYWMKKTKLLCRQEIYSCNIYSAKLIGLYAVKVPFCKNKLMTKFTTEGSALVVHCSDNSKEKYYFKVFQ